MLEKWIGEAFAGSPAIVRYGFRTGGGAGIPDTSNDPLPELSDTETPCSRVTVIRVKASTLKSKLRRKTPESRNHSSDVCRIRGILAVAVFPTVETVIPPLSPTLATLPAMLQSEKFEKCPGCVFDGRLVMARYGMSG